MYLMRCLNVDCPFNHEPARYFDLGQAEILAFAHESRQGAAHSCEVVPHKEPAAKPVSPRTAGATGGGGR